MGNPNHRYVMVTTADKVADMASHSAVAKQVLRTARKTSRRQDYSSSTKRALVESATELFTERGYSGTSLDEVVAAARVTKGALYHHFNSKLDLFESVFLRVQSDATEEITAAFGKTKDPWERAQAGLTAFLTVCRRPEYRRICMQEGPVALGHERWQEAEREASFGIVQNTVVDLLDEIGEDFKPLSNPFTVVFYGAIRSAAEYVADSDDPDVASDEVLATIGAIMLGMRSLTESPADAS